MWLQRRTIMSSLVSCVIISCSAASRCNAASVSSVIDVICHRCSQVIINNLQFTKSPSADALDAGRQQKMLESIWRLGNPESWPVSWNGFRKLFSDHRFRAMELPDSSSSSSNDRSGSVWSVNVEGCCWYVATEISLTQSSAPTLDSLPHIAQEHGRTSYFKIAQAPLERLMDNDSAHIWNQSQTTPVVKTSDNRSVMHSSPLPSTSSIGLYRTSNTRCLHACYSPACCRKLHTLFWTSNTLYDFFSNHQLHGFQHITNHPWTSNIYPHLLSFTVHLINLLQICGGGWIPLGYQLKFTYEFSIRWVISPKKLTSVQSKI